MRQIFLSLFAVAALLALPACNTVSDLVVTHVPDFHEGKTRIVVRLGQQQAYLYKGRSQVASSRISTGREGYHTPVGRFRVLRKDQDHRSSVYGYFANDYGQAVKENVDIRKDRRPAHAHFVGASMPYFLEFSPGYGLHAGYLPGFPASHGCVRMPYWKARQFFNCARIGTPVVVKP
jgi:lipoprotein-anchoring transpeptidase ErfK/SrfK